LGVGEARYEYGVMLISKGDKDNAKQQLNQALEIFEKLEANPDVQKVKEQLAKLQGAQEGKARKIKRIPRIKRKKSLSKE
jgi:hypothetical protein